MTVYAAPGPADSLDRGQDPLRPLHRRRVGRRRSRASTSRTPSPVNGKTFTEVARGTAEDIERALDAAHAAAPAWGRTSRRRARQHPATRSPTGSRQNLEMLAVAETWDNGKPVRETLAADIPLAIDHFRYFAGAIRAQEGAHLARSTTTPSPTTSTSRSAWSAQIIPWNFPILMAVWKLAPALAAGNAVVLKPAEQTPASILVLIELIGDLLPAGRAQHRQRLRRRGRQAAGLVQPDRQDRLHRRDHHRPADHAVRLARTSSRSPWSSAARARTSSSTTSPPRTTTSTTRRSRASRCSRSTRARSAPARRARSIQRVDLRPTSWRDAIERVEAIKQGNPLDTDTMIGAQASNDQLEKILSYIDIGKQEGAKVLTGGERADARRRPGRRLLRAADRSSRATTRCGSSRRRSSARWSR